MWDPVPGEMPGDPVDALEVGGEAVLDHQVLAEPKHVGGIEQGFLVRGHEELLRGPFEPLFDADRVGQVVRPVVRICQARFGCRLVAHVRVFVVIALHQRPVAEILEPPAAIGHGGFEHFAAHGQEHVARRHAAEARSGLPVRRFHRLAEVHRRGAVDANSAAFKHPSKIVELLVGLVDRLLRPRPPLPAHVGIFRHLGVERRFRRRNAAAVGNADNDMFERVPLVPGIDRCAIRRPGHVFPH